MSTPNETSQGGPLRLLGERVLRHSGTYLAGTGIELLLVLVRLIVLTRLLPIGTYGELAVLMIYAGFVTMGCRLAAVTGTLLSVFRGAGDDEAEEEDEEEEDREDPSEREQRRLLGTGLMMAIGLTVVLGAVSAIAWRPLDAALINEGHAARLVWATLFGGLNGIWYLTSSIARYERRPVIYVGLQALHATTSMVGAVILIQAGYGIDGAMGGLALGAAVSLIPGIFVSRHRFSIAFDRSHAAAIVKRGVPMAGITATFFLFRNIDLYMVSRYLPDSDVALYRIGARVGALSSAGISALLLAWGPLSRGPIRGAMTREGKLTDAGARLFFYYWIFAMVIVVGLFGLRGYLIKLAPSSYADATILIPMLGLATVITSGVVIAHRVGLHKRKRVLLASCGVGMTAVVVVASAILTPAYGLGGTVVAIIVAPSIALAAILTAAQRSGQPLPMRWGRMAAAAALGVAWVGGWELLVEAIGGPERFLLVFSAITFPFALVMTGIVERREALIIVGMLRRLAPSQGSPDDLQPALRRLSPPEFALIDRLVREGEPPSSVAADLGVDEHELRVQFVALIRAMGGPRRVGPVEDEIGAYLLDGKTNVNQRDREGHKLAMSGHLGSLELDTLNATVERIGKIKPRSWTALRP